MENEKPGMMEKYGSQLAVGFKKEFEPPVMEQYGEQAGAGFKKEFEPWLYFFGGVAIVAIFLAIKGGLKL